MIKNVKIKKLFSGHIFIDHILMRRYKKNRNIILLLLVLIIGVASYFIFPSSTSAPQTITPSTTTPSATTPSATTSPEGIHTAQTQPDEPTVIIGDNRIVLEVMQTSTELSKGLSGKPSLGAEHGMLFIFSKPALYQFWMPDMNFSIDILWIDNGKIIGITPEVPYTFDPQAPIFYKPPSPVQYVLEVNAGFTAEKNIQIGDTVIFENIPAKQ